MEMFFYLLSFSVSLSLSLFLFLVYIFSRFLLGVTCSICRTYVPAVQHASFSRKSTVSWHYSCPRKVHVYIYVGRLSPGDPQASSINLSRRVEFVYIWMFITVHIKDSKKLRECLQRWLEMIFS